MAKELKTVNFMSKCSQYQVLDKRMTRTRCYVMASGKNANGSNITYEAMQSCIPQLGNTPVVAHFFQKEDGSYRVGGHDSKLEVDSMGIRVVNQCVPFGVIPENCNPEIVEVAEQDGITKNYYLVCDVILWTGRYNIMDAKYDDNVYFSQSCELEIEKGHYDDEDYLVIEDFTLSALCLLNKSDNKEENVQPCFPSCRVEKLSFSLDETEKESFKAEFALLMEEVKSLSIEDNLGEKFAKRKKSTKKCEDKTDKKNKEVNKFMMDKIKQIFSVHKFNNEVGVETEKYAILSATENKINVIDREEGYNAFSFDYIVDGEEVVVDYESKTAKSLDVVDKKEEENFELGAEIKNHSENVSNFKVANYESAKLIELEARNVEISDSLQKVSCELAEVKGQLKGYQEAERVEAEKAHVKECEEVLEQFAEKLGKAPKFLIYCGQLKGDNYNKSIETIRGELTIMVGEQIMKPVEGTSEAKFGYQPTFTGKTPEQKSTSTNSSFLDKYIASINS